MYNIAQKACIISHWSIKHNWFLFKLLVLKIDLYYHTLCKVTSKHKSIVNHFYHYRAYRIKISHLEMNYLMKKLYKVWVTSDTDYKLFSKLTKSDILIVSYHQHNIWFFGPALFISIPPVGDLGSIFVSRPRFFLAGAVSTIQEDKCV